MFMHRLTAAATLIALAGASHALETHWSAALGELPDVVDPAWTLVDEGGGSPSFANGVLTLQTTTSISARQFYTMQGDELDFSNGTPYWIEAEMQYVTGSTYAGWWRAPAHIGIRLDNNRQVSLGIRRDSIFLLNADNDIAGSATVDTDDAFHTYRMEVLGTQTGALVNVYQDGALLLSKNALYAPPVASPSAVSWGESSTLVTGTSRWKSVRHNMAAVAVSPVPEPATWGLMAAGLLAVGAAARGRPGRA